MPRVAQPARGNGRGASKTAVAATPVRQSPMKMSFNDDAQEKAARLMSRHALHDLQMNQIKAAASPVRKLNNYQRAVSNSPRTPKGSVANRGKENEGDGIAVIPPNAGTPVKRVPILANFEEWMKMATDNKINATNSWNFALIDYFHDMSLLKEGDGVNFQKASCTLDGCVKIYTSRVDSVATETGKLLSGLAENREKKQKDNEEDEGEEDDDEGEDGVKRRTRKKAQRSSEATLAPSFAQLQLKKFELEFSVDPLFKKASADFDEGGAKGLLLNHLAIDAQGRIVFDSSDDASSKESQSSRQRKDEASIIEEDEEVEEDEQEQQEEVDAQDDEDVDIDISSLASRFFPDLARLDSQDICPSLKNFDLGDPSSALDIPFLKAPAEEWDSDHNNGNAIGNKSGIFLDEDNAPGFDDDEGLGGFDLPAETGFGEGGEAWARDAALDPQMRVQSTDFDSENRLDGEDGEAAPFDADATTYNITKQPQKDPQSAHEDILSYFDNALRKNWTGPEHWRIRRIKDATKSATGTNPPVKRKEKEPFEFDFLSPLDGTLAEQIYTPASSNSAISLPKKDWKAKNKNLLPDDKHFNSRSLLRLFLKPKYRLGSTKWRSRTLPPHASGANNGDANTDPPAGAEIDEAYWAAHKPLSAEDDAATKEGSANYDANFFQDDGLAFADGGMPDDEEIFADAREAFSPSPPTADANAAENAGLASLNAILAGNGAATSGEEGAFGTQLVTQSRRMRPEYVQYARVAKKVDVRRLKEELWKGSGLEFLEKSEAPGLSSSADSSAAVSGVVTPMTPDPEPVSSSMDEKPLKFTTLINNLSSVYPTNQLADISTSYCFICLLHLANEKGLVIENEPGWCDLSVRKDWTADLSAV